MSDFMPDYRAKRIDNGKWVEGEKVTDCKQVCIVVSGVFLPADKCDDDYNSRIIGDIYEVDPKTLCKNTTATMPDGSYVWEGDLFNLNGTENVYEVIWDNRWFCWNVINKNNPDDSYFLSTVIDCPRESARIGNRHDNPELVGGAK